MIQRIRFTQSRIRLAEERKRRSKERIHRSPAGLPPPKKAPEHIRSGAFCFYLTRGTITFRLCWRFLLPAHVDGDLAPTASIPA